MDIFKKRGIRLNKITKCIVSINMINNKKNSSKYFQKKKKKNEEFYN